MRISSKKRDRSTAKSTAVCGISQLPLYWLRLAVITMLVAFSFNSLALAATISDLYNEKLDRDQFDHLSTGYELTGDHKYVECENCHVGGIFDSLPRQCEFCHDNIFAAGKSPTHIITSRPCDNCHTESGFVATAVMDHSLISNSCAGCHNGVTATGKSVDHVLTTPLCEACHDTSSWVPVIRVDHDEVRGNCSSCHNNDGAIGKGPNHVPTTNACDTCHNTASWDSQFDHNTVIGQPCYGCHNGIDAGGKPQTHIDTSNLCGACHVPGANWSDVLTVDHDQVNGPCGNCHSKSNNHPITNDNCETCHFTDRWNSTQGPTVLHANIPAGSCSSCHDGSIATGKSSDHCPTSVECDVCHGSFNNWEQNVSGC